MNVSSSSLSNVRVFSMFSGKNSHRASFDQNEKLLKQITRQYWKPFVFLANIFVNKGSRNFLKCSAQQETECFGNKWLYKTFIEQYVITKRDYDQQRQLYTGRASFYPVYYLRKFLSLETKKKFRGRITAVSFVYQMVFSNSTYYNFSLIAFLDWKHQFNTV